MTKLACAVLFLISALPALAQNPFVASSPVNATTPFNITLPSTLPSGKPAKSVVIEFVTADCQTAPGVPAIGAAKLNVFFQSNFAIYTLGFDAPLSFVNSTEFVSAKQTLIFADPGTSFVYGISGGQPTCTVVVSGYFQ